LDFQFSNSAAAELPPLISPGYSSRAWIIWALVSVLALSTISAVVAAPLAMANGHSTFAGSIYNTFLSRFVTGALLSATAVFYIIPGLMQLANRQRVQDPFASK